jgi:type 2 lantibiotic biosynthesis protein LanM
MSATISARLPQLSALTLEERIDLFRRLPPGSLSAASSPRGDHFDLFHSAKAISAKTFQSYGMPDLARLEPTRAKAKNLLEALPPFQWLNDFEAQYRSAGSRLTPRWAHPEVGACDCLWPLINAAIDDVREFLARRRAKRAALQIEEEQVLNGATVQLYGKLFAACARAVVVELGAAHAKGLLHGETPQERFAFFVDCLRDTSFSRKILGQYPVLIRQAVTLAADWRDALVEFLTRLTMDWGGISTTFFGGRDVGPLSTIEVSAGDCHNRGRAVIIAQFQEGSRLVYKPKSLAIDHHFAKLVDWVNARAVDFSLATPILIDKTTYGWSEFVAQRPCATLGDVKEFYRRQGANLALLYVLGGCDLHSENLIADGDTPKLIDLETLFHPIFLPEETSGATKQAHLAVSQSVLKTGLLPYRSKELPAPEDSVDLSGLGNIEAHELPFEMVVWENTNTDQMQLAKRKPMTTADQNLPIHRGKRVGPDRYVNEITEGFGSAYRLLCAHKNALLAADGPIHAMKGDKVRVVVRATNRYVLLLEESFHPEYLSDALAREAFFDSLWEEARDLEVLAALVPAERRDLWHGDVPYFWTRADAVDLWTSTGARIPNVVEVSGFDAALARIAQLGEEDLGYQTNLICSALAVVKQQNRAAPTLRLRLVLGGESSTDPIQIARRIGQRIAQTAIHDGDGASWVIFSQTSSTHVAAAPAAADLYDGLPGIALFLGHLGAVTGDARLQELSRLAVIELLKTPSLRERGRPAGAFAGLGGVIYVLAHLSQFMPDLSCADIAEELARLLAKDLDAAVEIDVIAGLAGIVLAALGAANQAQRCAFFSLAVRAGHALTDQVADPRNPQHREILEGRKWPLSFAHGRAGVAYALIKLYEASGQQRFNIAGLELAERELTDIDRIGRNSSVGAPDHAGAAASQLAWCHGKPGVALALKVASEGGDKRKIDATVSAVISAINSSPLERSDCICHGNLGNLLLVRELMDDELRAGISSGLERKVVRRISRHGVVCGNFGLETAGLMEGLAGMGLALLKLAEPARIPNVLILEPASAG